MNRRHSWKWLATAASLAVGLALIASACGSSSNKSAGSGGDDRHQRPPPAAARHSPTSASLRHRHRLPRPGSLVHRRGLGDHVERLPAPARVQARERPGRRDDRAVPREGSAEGLGRRQDVQLHASQTGLKYSDGTPVKASDFAASIERDFKVDSPGVGFFGEHRRRGHVRQDEERSHQRHHDRRLDRRHHDQAERAAGRLLEHPRHRVRGARAREHAGQGPVDDAAALDGPVHDQELRAEQAGRSSFGTRTSTRRSSTATCRRATRT